MMSALGAPRAKLIGSGLAIEQQDKRIQSKPDLNAL
jgi:hypothetical protein